MQLTVEKLRKLGECEDGIEFFISLDETDVFKAIEKALQSDNPEKYNHVGWWVLRLLNKDDRMRYALHAASGVDLVKIINYGISLLKKN